MTFELGDSVVLSELGAEQNSLGRGDTGEVDDYDGDNELSYPYRVMWEQTGRTEWYSRAELELWEAGVPEVPTLKGYALWISKQEVTQ